MRLDDLPLEGVDFTGAELEGTHFSRAKLNDAYFDESILKDATFMGAKLERATFMGAALEGANFTAAKLKNAHFMEADLSGVNFEEAQLEGVKFCGAHLEGANFIYAHVSRANFEEAILFDANGVGPRLANVRGWDEVFLAQVDWSSIKILQDEKEAKRFDTTLSSIIRRRHHLGLQENEYRTASRTYRQLATVLESQGLKEEAEQFMYRSHVMQRKMLWELLWKEKQSLRRRIHNAWAYSFYSLLATMSGYGYRFGRTLLSYLCILLVFAVLYFNISQGTAHPLGWLDAGILSISDMVGRGFFRQDVSLSDPYAGWSVLEGMIGVFLDVLLISTLTQRLFKK